MQLSHKFEDNVCVLKIEGSLALIKSEDFEAYTQPLLNEAQYKRMVVNLEDVSRIDSSGLGILTGLLKRTKGRSIELALCALSEMEKEVFEISRLDRLFLIYDTEKEAREI